MMNSHLKIPNQAPEFRDNLIERKSFAKKYLVQLFRNFLLEMPPINPINPVPPELKKINGIDKLRRQLEKEIQSPNVNEKSSNLPHLLSILKCIKDLTPPTLGKEEDKQEVLKKRMASAVLKPFPFSGGKSGKLVVDLVSTDGDCWYKVSARNPKALSLLAAGGGGYRQKSIVDHVEDYLDCAKENPCLFRTPKVTVIFTSGISEALAEELESLGAFVQGERIPDEQLGIHPRIKVYEDSSNLKEFQDHQLDDLALEDNEEADVLGYKNPSLEGITKLNLDITALLAYLSNLTNGNSDVEFTKKILSDQARAEKERPQKPVLDKIFEGRELYCCETALKFFQNILHTVGGPVEKERAKEFLKRVTILPDQISERVQSLSVSGNIKNRSLAIFGTGDSIQAFTVSANSGFVRSAKTQGVDLAAFIHESRALTEQKENLQKSS